MRRSFSHRLAVMLAMSAWTALAALDPRIAHEGSCDNGWIIDWEEAGGRTGLHFDTQRADAARRGTFAPTPVGDVVGINSAERTHWWRVSDVIARRLEIDWQPDTRHLGTARPSACRVGGRIRASQGDWHGALVILGVVIERMVGAMRPTARERVEVARSLVRIGRLVRPPAPDPRDADAKTFPFWSARRGQYQQRNRERPQ